MTDVSVVGAGLSGALLGRRLAAQGLDVVLLDKGRGPGGRLSGRRHPTGRFQHGAPHLHLAPDEHDLVAEVADWEASGVIVRAGDAWQSTPGNALVKWLLRDLDVRFGERVTALSQEGAGWTLRTSDEVVYEAGAVVLAIPAPQAVALLGEHPLAHELAAVSYEPCWVGMLRLAEPWSGNTTAVAVRESTGDGRSWAVHATTAWSQAHLEDAPAEVVAALLDELPELRASQVVEATAHRWRYAHVQSPLHGRFRWDAEARVGAVGDSFGRGAGAALGSAKAAALAIGGLR